MEEFPQPKTAPKNTAPENFDKPAPPNPPPATDPMVTLESIPVMAVLTNAKGIVSHVNQRFLQTTGYAAADVLGKPLTHLWREPHDQWNDICKQIDATGAWQAVIRHQKSNGAAFKELGAISKIPGTDGNQFQLLKVGYPVSATLLKDAVPADLDQTPEVYDRDKDCRTIKTVQSAIAENEQSYLDILNSAPHSITLSRVSDGKYVFVNDAYCKRTGYQREEVLGRRASDLNLFYSETERQRLIDEVQTNNRVDNLEMQFLRKDGQTYHTLVSARILRFRQELCLLYIVTNIDKLKAYQKALAESEESYRNILKVAPYSITISRISDGVYLEANDTFCEFIGYSKGEVLGNRHQELNFFADPDERRRFVKTLMQTGQVNNMEMTYKSRTGERAVGLLSARIITYQGQQCVMSLNSNITELKNIQGALMESEESYRTIMDAAPYSITITRLSDGRYVEVNKAFTERAGFSREEAVGKTYRELGVFHDKEAMKEFLKIYLEHGQVDNMKLRLRTKDGSERFNLASARTIRYKGQDCLLYISSNIDELVAAEKELAEREETYRTILDTAPYPISINSAVTGKYLQVNEAHTRGTGYRQEEMIGRTPDELNIFLDPADRRRLMKIFKRDGRVFSMEMTFRAKDGKALESLISMSPIRYKREECTVAMTVDINELKSAQRALQESESRFRAIFETAADPIFLNDMQTGQFINVNRAACRHLGYDKSDFLTMNLQSIRSAETADPLAFFEAKDNEDEGVFYESRHVRKNGSVAIVEVSSQQLIHQGRKVLLSIARDITQRRQTEEELARYRENLEQIVAERTNALQAAQNELVKQEKLAVLGQLTATVSHELRNPLGVIRSSNYFLQSKLKSDDAKTKKHFKRIDEQVSLCDNIVGDLLEYTRGRKVTAARQNLAKWLTEVAAIQQDQEKINIQLAIDANLPPVPYDQEKLRRVIINLITNAVQAVNAKAEACDSCGQAFVPNLCLEAGAADDHIKITIRDNGCGMNLETQSKAFEPLFTTRARGTGLGLAIVKKIIEEHGGQVFLKSREGDGTEVSLMLPLADHDVTDD